MNARSTAADTVRSEAIEGSLPDLLQSGDPPPFSFWPDTRSDVLLLCDHAAQAVPARLAGLGVARAELDRHIGWDPHAAELTRLLARHLAAPAFLHGYSRLVVDSNRFFDDPTCFPEVSDGTLVPANRDLGSAERTQRWQQLHQPYHRAIGTWLDESERAGRVPALISVHTFVESLAGQARPWPIGVLWNHDGRLAQPFLEALRADGLLVGDNQPYSGREGFGYSMAVHAEARGLPHLLIEVRQDLLAEAVDRVRWADRLVRVLRPLLAEADLYRRWQPEDEHAGSGV